MTLAAAAQAAPAYSYSFIGDAPFVDTGSTQAMGINNAGQVVGYSYDNSANEQAVIWNGSTTPTALGTLTGGTGSQATAINSTGQVVGVTNTATINNKIATIWNGTCQPPSALCPEAAPGLM